MEVINAECQVFTPHDVVVEVLNQVGYIENLYGKKVFENSCGDGAFLVEIVNRYILDCLNQEISNDRIVLGLENDIYGAEIDKAHKETCISNLDNVIHKYNIRDVKWNIMNIDVLKTPLNIKFQYIIGNPPYITYSDLNKFTRNFIKENFDVCIEGKPDYYYAFIEMSIKALANDGRLAYLIPNNIFKNRFANRLRTFMLPYLTEIIDYTSEKLFESKQISSAVIICEGICHDNHIRYINKVKDEEFLLNKNYLNNKWVFIKKSVSVKEEKRKFGDDFSAMCSIATLLNEAFILKNYEEHDKYILVNDYKVERSVLREAVSPRSIQYKKRELIIFPYYYDKGNDLMRYEEVEFMKMFPEATRYLNSFIKKLKNRDKDENAKWFEFGRSQALRHLNKEKLLMSTVVTDSIKTYYLSNNKIPYAGICIYQKGKLSLEFAEKILKSDEFLNYVSNIGINVSGTSMRITAKDVMNFEYRLD